MASSQVYVVRNEPDPEHQYHCDALASLVPNATEIDFPAGERFDPADADAVVLTGSTAGVYEGDDRPWIDEQQTLVRELLDRTIPTLGVCFGHQVINAALGGTVTEVGMTVGLVEAELVDIPLFEAVDPIVPAFHGDAVTQPGDGMEVVATAGHVEAFATRHRSAPIWTVQFHPELNRHHLGMLNEFGWEDNGYSFEDVSADDVPTNFLSLINRDAELRTTG